MSKEPLALIAIIFACTAMIFFVAWLDERCQRKRLRTLYNDLQERFHAYMNKHEHCMACDLCDNRAGCPKFVASKFYIACPFWEHHQGGVDGASSDKMPDSNVEANINS